MAVLRVSRSSCHRQIGKSGRFKTQVSSQRIVLANSGSFEVRLPTDYDLTISLSTWHQQMEQLLGFQLFDAVCSPTQRLFAGFQIAWVRLSPRVKHLEH